MDAISFVLGVRGSQIRSTELRDLIYSSSAVRGDADDAGSESDDGAPQRASVTAVIEDTKGGEHRFQRVVNVHGASEYRYNGHTTTQASYQAKLEQLHIMVKARNFLVFQGDVESIAEQCSKDLSEVIDRISGSKTLESEYDAARTAYQEAVEHSAALVSRRKTLQSELRQVRQHKEASDRYDALKQELHGHLIRKTVWRLYHIHEILEIHTDWIEAHTPRGEQLQKRCHEREQAVAEARQLLGVLQQSILDKEGERKQALRALDAVRPDKDRITERAEHSRRKLAQARQLHRQAEKDHAAQRDALARLGTDTQLAEAALEQAKNEQEAALAATSLTLSEADLEAYHALKQQSSSLHPDERTELEQLYRTQRSKKGALEVLQDKRDDVAAQLARLAQQNESLAEAEAAVAARTPACADALAAAQGRLASVRDKKEKLELREKELNDALVVCYQQLLRMGQDQRAHERESKLRTSLRSLQSMFSGVHGRLVDLCKPTQRKFELAITTALGRYAEAVVVNHESTAMECIEVCGRYLRSICASSAPAVRF